MIAVGSEVKLLCVSLNFESILHLSNRHILCNLANSDLHTIFVNGHLGRGHKDNNFNWKSDQSRIQWS